MRNFIAGMTLATALFSAGLSIGGSAFDIGWAVTATVNVLATVVLIVFKP